MPCEAYRISLTIRLVRPLFYFFKTKEIVFVDVIAVFGVRPHCTSPASLTHELRDRLVNFIVVANPVFATE